MHVQPGSAVWVRSVPSSVTGGAAPTGAPVCGADWLPAVVTSVDENGAAKAARTENGAVWKVSPRDVELRSDEHGVQDLIRLAHMNEPSVLDALSRRYASGEIYTRTGPGIVIALNPFRPVDGLYDAAAMEAHRSEGLSGDDGGPRAPHIFGVASHAYWRMRREGKGQALLVTGESGAGKTETSKLLMKYLAYLGGYKAAAAASRDGSDDDDAERASVEQRVLESNPLLEAFGNAKTVRNDNSSRFGKYIELHFCGGGSISGARIHTYLLERSRLVHPAKGERNYHIFYQLLAGATPHERERWRLGPDATSHRLTAASGCVELPGVDDGELFRTTRHAMRAVGISVSDQEQVFALLAALLHLSDLSFAPCPRDGDEGCALAGGGDASLAAAAGLLGVDAAALRKAVTTRTRATPDGPIVSPLQPKAAAETRDALSKVIYARLFDWLVTRINMAIGEDLRRTTTIGLLDIYGFESFEFNDLEQFCINLANEKLQQHFNHHVFKQQQAEYEREGIDWSYIDFVDNADVLELMEGRLGLLDLLDEACRFPSATPRDLADKLFAGAAPAASARFSRAKKSVSAFQIEHYAGPVVYQTDHMLDKNRDFVISEHQALLAAARLPLTRALFPDDTPGPATLRPAGSGGGARSGGGVGGFKGSAGNLKGFQFVSVGSQFKRQLADLSAKLSQLQPHYVRCIKPNPRNAPFELDSHYTLEQLKCGGVMEAVRISNAGYPLRRTFGEFLDAYSALAPGLRAKRISRRRMTQGAAAGGPALAAAANEDRADLLALLRGLGDAAGEGVALSEGRDWQIGKSMVFLRAGAAAALARLHVRAQAAAAVRLQAGWRGAAARREAEARRAAAVRLQALARGAAARREARRRREARAAAVLQAALRGAAARRGLRATVRAATVLQAALRGRAARALASQMERSEALIKQHEEWRARAPRCAAAMMRAVGGTSALPRQPPRAAAAAAPQDGSDGGAAPAVSDGGKPKARPRYRAAARIQAAWRLARPAHASYKQEHHLAATVIQQHWRNRGRLRSEARAAALRGALVEYAARHDSAARIQAAWRGHKDRAVTRKLLAAKRRDEFRRNAAMFQTMAAAAGAAKPPMPSPLQAAYAILAVSGAKGEGGAGEVVKGDAAGGGLARAGSELLEARGIGQLRDSGKVTSLLGIWQHRLSHQRARQEQAKKREQLVWQRQQQLLKQAAIKGPTEEVEVEFEEPPSPVPVGPPMLF
ncbi:hypothetical protein Rsub_02594 [Raphidocelis subcapitata]|uniref:Myosin motor domain-containing protein n=1 Tax=Raphidocelis subcapitata TaxID=307507 RepID=A0A2V0NWE8_9CHLO|nr:hypothetical protein Rsub_02594 [Raphidocelis subcapitata]|eukprot:GBF89890.1 hypothetical protein Rsub_02594 [Raphidocelis subcapitata]